MKCAKAVGQEEMASPCRQPDVCPTPTTARAAADPCSRWRLMRTVTALVTEQDSKLFASRQGVVDVEEEEEVTVARAANRNIITETSLRGFGRGGVYGGSGSYHRSNNGRAAPADEAAREASPVLRPRTRKQTNGSAGDSKAAAGRTPQRNQGRIDVMLRRKEQQR